MSSKSFITRMDNSANYAAGRGPQLATLARGIIELVASVRRTAVALHVAGRDNSVTDASPRSSARARGQDPYPALELRARFRKGVESRCGPMDVYMMASDDG